MLAATIETTVAVGNSDLTFDTRSVSGSNGTSFVYFQAHEVTSGRTRFVPTRRFAGCPVPYYVVWKNVIYRPNSTSYDAVIYSCATGKPIDNQLRSGELLWGPGQRTLIAGVQALNATGQLVYALNVGLNPAQVVPGQATTLSAGIADDFVAQADRTLNISVDPAGWSVTSWAVEYGDGQTATVPGGGRSISASHTYGAPAAVRPKVTAHVAGTAQVADFDPVTGDLVLVPAPFTVDVTNSTAGQVNSQPVVAYDAPQVRAAVVAQLGPGAPDAFRRGLAAIEVPRGTTVFLYVRPIVDREGVMTLDGKPGGSGQTQVLGWTLSSGSSDGPLGAITRPGTGGASADAIAQQWNTPDKIGSGGPLPYSLAIDYTVRTTYPDGQTRDYRFSGTIAVTVAYSANSG
jgi:hypothetical protein